MSIGIVFAGIHPGPIAQECAESTQSATTTLLALPDEVLVCVLEHTSTAAILDNVAGHQSTSLVSLMQVRARRFVSIAVSPAWLGTSSP